MKKTYLLLLVLLGITISCTKNFEDFNEDKKNPLEVQPEFLFANAQKDLGDQVASTNVNLNVWKLFAQYWTETTYTDEANYDIVNRTIADYTFRAYYRNVLSDLQEASKIIETEEAILESDQIVKANKLLIIDLVSVYCYNRLVDIFGNVPYTEALDIDNISPKYDDAATIYQDLIDRCNNAIVNLDPSEGSFGGDDLYFAGDVAMWIKFGNALKIKMGITIAEFDGALAKATVESAYDKSYDPGETCQINYPGGTNSNPLYQDLVQSGRHDFVVANTIVDIMNDLNDPRRDDFFEINGTEYVGGIYGESNNFDEYSHISDDVQAATYPMILQDYVETAFYLTEAAARGYSVGMTADEWYEEAVTASIMQWGGTQIEADDYLAQTDVAWDAANWEELVGTQEWLAFYVRGLLGYTTWRRLEYPAMNLPPTPRTDDGQVPNRFTYPINEQTLNASNWAAAGQAIGGDLMSTRIFWDVD